MHIELPKMSVFLPLLGGLMLCTVTAVHAHEGHEGPGTEEPAQAKLIREESPRDGAVLTFIQDARGRCFALAEQSPGNMAPAGQEVTQDAAWMSDCVANAFTDLMVETMHEFILFQGTEIYRHCTTGEMGGRMDNFGACMQPFDILIERVSAPCSEAFGRETGMTHDCIKLFNEKMLARVSQMAGGKERPEADLGMLWYTLGAAVLIACALMLIYKRL